MTGNVVFKDKASQSGLRPTLIEQHPTEKRFQAANQRLAETERRLDQTPAGRAFVDRIKSL